MRESHILAEIEREFGEYFDNLPQEAVDEAMKRILLRKLIQERIKNEILEGKGRDLSALLTLVAPCILVAAFFLM